MERSSALKILELNTTQPTPDEIKKAYRRLSLKFHPDKQYGKSEKQKREAEEKFKEINAAYQALDKSASSSVEDSEDLAWLVKTEVKSFCTNIGIKVEEVLTSEWKDRFKRCVNREQVEEELKKFYYYVQDYCRHKQQNRYHSTSFGWDWDGEFLRDYPKGRSFGPRGWNRKRDLVDFIESVTTLVFLILGLVYWLRKRKKKDSIN